MSLPRLASLAGLLAVTLACCVSGVRADDTIVLDPSIRDWVLLPIFLVMFGQGQPTPG